MISLGKDGLLYKKMLISALVIIASFLLACTVGYALTDGTSEDSPASDTNQVTACLTRDCSPHNGDLSQFRNAMQPLLAGQQISDDDLLAVGLAACQAKTQLAFVENSQNLSVIADFNETERRKTYNAARTYFCRA